MESTGRLEAQITAALRALRKAYEDSNKQPPGRGEDLERILDAWDEYVRDPGHGGCECSGELVAGVRWPADPHEATPPPGWSWVEHCDACRRFGTDEDAASALIAAGVGARYTLFAHAPGAAAGRGCAIDVPPDFPRGFRFQLTSPVDRYPHFLADPGLTGTVTECGSGELWLHMDKPLEGAEPWGNDIQFLPDEHGRPPLSSLLRDASLIVPPGASRRADG
jgi:hypothetical protein